MLQMAIVIITYEVGFAASTVFVRKHHCMAQVLNMSRRHSLLAVSNPLEATGSDVLNHVIERRHAATPNHGRSDDHSLQPTTSRGVDDQCLRFRL